MKQIDKKIIEKAIKDPAIRTELAKKSHYFFFHIYFHDYVTYKVANFQKEMFKISEDENVMMAVICGFRNSGKSSIMTASYPIWSILGKMERKFVVILSQTAELAKQHFSNLKRELENNDLLKQDLGPFQQQDEWNSCSLIIPKYNAKIIAVSKEQSFRGIRHGKYRPDLIIGDDIENLASVKSEESRKQTYDWFNGEVMPLRADNAKVVILGNLLHEDSLISRLGREINEEIRDGVYREYPLIDDKGKIAWPGKYKDMDEVKKEEKIVGDKFAWAREYLLIVADDQEPVISKEWIRYYQKLPRQEPVAGNINVVAYASGVDIAVSEKDKADYTAIVSCKIFGEGKNKKIYILPNPINAKNTLPTTIDNIVKISNYFKQRHSYKIYIEEVGTQKGLTQILKEKGIKTEGINIRGNDKRTRLCMVSKYIEEGRILFPAIGAEELLKQMLSFGLQKHDDLVDAFTTLIQGIEEKPPSMWCGFAILNSTGFTNYNPTRW